MSLRQEILQILADGQWHSGEEIAKAFSLSRTAIWKHLSALDDIGIEVNSKRGYGYQIPGGLDLLSSDAIQQAFRDGRQALNLSLLAETDSTNQELLRRAEHDDIHKQVILAEYQNAGRGRRGRHWQCPYAAGLLLSTGWRFSGGSSSLAGLSLAVGVMIREALHSCGCSGIGLKWPNDIYIDFKKLGGVLIELRGELASEFAVVIGIGINVYAQPPASAQLRVPATCLRTGGSAIPARSVLAAKLLENLFDGLEAFSLHGFTAFRDRWLAEDITMNRQVIVGETGKERTGTVLGVDSDGALLLQTDSRVERVLAGDVSVRL